MVTTNDLSISSPIRALKASLESFLLDTQARIGPKTCPSSPSRPERLSANPDSSLSKATSVALLACSCIDFSAASSALADASLCSSDWSSLASRRESRSDSSLSRLERNSSTAVSTASDPTSLVDRASTALKSSSREEAALSEKRRSSPLTFSRHLILASSEASSAAALTSCDLFSSSSDQESSTFSWLSSILLSSSSARLVTSWSSRCLSPILVSSCWMDRSISFTFAHIASAVRSSSSSSSLLFLWYLSYILSHSLTLLPDPVSIFLVSLSSFRRESSSSIALRRSSR